MNEVVHPDEYSWAGAGMEHVENKKIYCEECGSHIQKDVTPGDCPRHDYQVLCRDCTRYHDEHSTSENDDDDDQDEDDRDEDDED